MSEDHLRVFNLLSNVVEPVGIAGSFVRKKLHHLIQRFDQLTSIHFSIHLNEPAVHMPLLAIFENKKEDENKLELTFEAL